MKHSCSCHDEIPICISIPPVVRVDNLLTMGSWKWTWWDCYLYLSPSWQGLYTRKDPDRTSWGSVRLQCNPAECWEVQQWCGLPEVIRLLILTPQLWPLISSWLWWVDSCHDKIPIRRSLSWVLSGPPHEENLLCKDKTVYMVQNDAVVLCGMVQ